MVEWNLRNKMALAGRLLAEGSVDAEFSAAEFLEFFAQHEDELPEGQARAFARFAKSIRSRNPVPSAPTSPHKERR